MSADQTTARLDPSRARRFLLGVAVVAAALLRAAGADAQAPAATVPSSSSPPPAASAAPGTAPPAAAGAPGWGGRLGAAEVSIVGGNVASARERALTEALKQAVEQAVTTAFPEAKTQQPKAVAQVLGRARNYVRRYRTVEEGERAHGLYALKVEADVDEGALARVFDKPASAGGPSASSPVPAGAPAYFLVGTGAPDALVAAARSFASAGARIQQAPSDLTEPSKTFEAAGRAGFTQVAFVGGSATPEGKVRGPGFESAACSFTVRVMAAGSGLPIADENESARGFSERADAARVECFQRAAAAAIPRVVPAVGARGTPVDVRAVVVEADVVEPGAVPGLVRHLRGIGSVSAIEVRRIGPGRAELWARSRLPASALAAALARDTGGSLTVSGVEVSGDLIRLRARTREPIPAAPANPPGVAPPSGPAAVTPAPAVPAPKGPTP